MHTSCGTLYRRWRHFRIPSTECSHSTVARMISEHRTGKMYVATGACHSQRKAITREHDGVLTVASPIYMPRALHVPGAIDGRGMYSSTPHGVHIAAHACGAALSTSEWERRLLSPRYSHTAIAMGRAGARARGPVHTIVKWHDVMYGNGSSAVESCTSSTCAVVAPAQDWGCRSSPCGHLQHCLPTPHPPRRACRSFFRGSYTALSSMPTRV